MYSATCTMICLKDDMVIGSVGAVARRLINKDFLQKGKGGCTLCSMCAKVCPTGALEVRKAGKSEMDDSYLSGIDLKYQYNHIVQLCL